MFKSLLVRLHKLEGKVKGLQKDNQALLMRAVEGNSSTPEIDGTESEKDHRRAQRSSEKGEKGTVEILNSLRKKLEEGIVQIMAW